MDGFETSSTVDAEVRAHVYSLVSAVSKDEPSFIHLLYFSPFARCDSYTDPLPRLVETATSTMATTFSVTMHWLA